MKYPARWIFLSILLTSLLTPNSSVEGVVNADLNDHPDNYNVVLSKYAGVNAPYQAASLFSPQYKYNWSPVCPSPSKRYGAASTYDSIHNRMIIFDGFAKVGDESMINDLWFYDFNYRAWQQISTTGNMPPAGRLLDYYSMAFDAPRNRVILMESYASRTYELDLGTMNWSLSSIALPESYDRSNFGLVSGIVTDTANNRLIIMTTDQYQSWAAWKPNWMKFWSIDLTVVSPTWIQLSPTGSTPAPRLQTSMLYDSTRGRILLFAGYDSSGAETNDIWSLSLNPGSEVWQQFFPTGSLPHVRCGQAAVYDNISDTFIIFGGHYNNSSSVLNDTWVINPGVTNWTQITTTLSPSATFGSAACFVPLSQEMILFGGSRWDNGGTSDSYGDTWSFDISGSSWQLLSPKTRWAFSAVIDESNNRAVTFAGLNVDGYQNDVQSLNLNLLKWGNIQTSGTAPSARDGHSAISDCRRHRMIVFGGFRNSTRFNDLYSLNLSTLAWTQLSPTGSLPSARVGHSAVYDNTTDCMIIFGGDSGSGSLNDLYSLNLETLIWTKLSPTGGPPTARDSHSAILDEGNRRMIIMDGEDSGGGALSDIWSLNMMTLAWTPLSPSGMPPAPRLLASAVYDNITGAMIVFGGRYSTTNYFNDIYLLNLSPGNESWSQPVISGALPEGRYGHVAVYDRTAQHMIIAAGNNGHTTNSYLQDTWILSKEIISTPTVATDNATSITSTTATLNGTLTADGGESCQYRFCRGTSPGVYTDNTTWSTDNKTSGQSFSASISGLTAVTKYYCVARCKNNAGTGTGLENSFTTLASVPTVTNASGATSIMATTAILHGNLMSTGGADTAVVIYSGTTDGETTKGNWGQSDNLSIGATGPFSLGVMGLTPSTTYFYRCYAENSAGGSWASSSTSFTTQAPLGLWRNYWEGPGKDWFWFSSGTP